MRFLTRIHPVSWIAGAALLSACVSDEPIVTPEPESPVEAPDEEVVETTTTAEQFFVLAEFDGNFDAETQEFSIEMVDPSDWITPPELRTVRPIDGPVTVEQAAWCENRVASSGTDTVRLSTALDSLAYTVADCGWPEVLPYTFLGMFCADVMITSNFTETLSTTLAQIVYVNPETGYDGYRHPYGNGVDMAIVDAWADGQENPPTDNRGLFLHADDDGEGNYTLEPGEGIEVQWTFQNGGGNFSFRGRVVSAYQEACNGVDDDCDGRVDEGNGCLDIGDPCEDNIDCAIDLCTGNRCGETSVVIPGLTATGGGAINVGEGSGGGSSVTLDINVGTPAMGPEASSASHTVNIGPN